MANSYSSEPPKQRREAIIRRLNKLTEIYTNFFQEMGVSEFKSFSYLNDFISSDSNIFCIGRIVPGNTTDVLMENNVYFENYDPLAKRTTICNLELKAAQQAKVVDGELVYVPECMFFPSQIVVVEGNYSKESNTFDCKYIYFGILMKFTLTSKTTFLRLITSLKRLKMYKYFLSIVTPIRLTMRQDT